MPEDDPVSDDSGDEASEPVATGAAAQGGEVNKVRLDISGCWLNAASGAPCPRVC